MTCAAFADRLPDLLEGTLDAETRASLEAHAESCPACAALLADLQRMQARATTLERLSPPRGGWQRLAARLQADPQFQRTVSAGNRRRPVQAPHAAATSLTWTWVALAASLVIGLTVALVLLQRDARQSSAGPRVAGAASATGSPSAGNPAETPSVESVEMELQKATEHFEKAVAQLEVIAQSKDSPLDAETKARFDEGIAVIDKAIVDTRVALRTQPGNTMAQESLFDAFRRKVALLQDTIALMNEMRKGNQAGAARLAESEKS
jgi:anti-sigma factor RsiW